MDRDRGIGISSKRIFIGICVGNATISHDGRMVAYTRDNNIYISNLDYGTDNAVTTDGKVNSIIYGSPDWAYEEEFGMQTIEIIYPEVSFHRIEREKRGNCLAGLVAEHLYSSLYPKIVVYSDAKKHNFKVRLANVKLKDIDLWAKENLSLNRVALRSKTLNNAS